MGWSARARRAIALSLVATAVLCRPAATDAAADSPPVVATFGDHDGFFSPDGDGHYERARFIFRLDARSAVTMLVRDHASQVVRTWRLGRLGEGRHVWAWNGKTSGHRLPDGHYTVVLRAWSGNRFAKVSAGTDILTTPDAGRLMLSRPTVYPAATTVADRLAVVYLREGYSEFAAEYPEYYGDDIPLRTRIVIRAPDGEAVYRALRRGYRPRFLWTARDADGHPLPAGTYQLRVTVRDSVGNVRAIRRSVSVSSAQLREQVWTSTFAATDASLGSPPLYDPGCNSCDVTCGPVPSERFAGGLSFRQPCSFGDYSRAVFGASPSVTPAPVDSYRVTATGGPTAPGDTDVALLSGVRLGPGDVTVSTPWQRVDLTDYPYLPAGAQPVTWAVSTSDENDYDVASFTVEYRYYAPIP